MKVSRDFRFEASHFLTHYKGKPEPLHGHTWTLRVTLEGPVGPDGMVFDFLELDRVVRERVLARVHHRHWNDLLPNPSTELAARWIWEQLRDLPLAEIRLWEGPDAFVTYTGDAS